MIEVGRYVITTERYGIIPKGTIGMVMDNLNYFAERTILIKILISCNTEMLDNLLMIKNNYYTELLSAASHISKPVLEAEGTILHYNNSLDYIPNCYSNYLKLRFDTDVINTYRQESPSGSFYGTIAEVGLDPWNNSFLQTSDSYRENYKVNNTLKKPKEKLIMEYSVTTKELLKLFKYVPIKSDFKNGFYDHKNSKIVIFGYDSFGDPNIKIKTNFKADIDFDLCHRFNIQPLFDYCKFKVKSYEKSASLFRFGALKRSLVGKELPATQLAINTKVNNSEELQNTIFIINENRKTRFVLEDIEIIYPNISGYYPKADRTIRPGNKVKVINDKYINYLKKGDITKVESIKTIGTKTYAAIKVNDKIIYERLNKFKKIC